MQCMAADLATGLAECEKNTAIELQLFKETDDVNHVLKAADVIRRLDFIGAAVNATNGNDTVLRLKLEFLQACYDARDHGYDLTNHPRITTVVSPPWGSADVPFSGMDPKDIKDPVLRKEYEDKIADNERRRHKHDRELVLQRVLDDNLRTVGHLLRGQRDPTCRQHFMEIVDATIKEKKLREKLVESVSPK
jgi:hypothetical protein